MTLKKELLQDFLENKISFRNFVDNYKSMHELPDLIYNDEVKELIKNNKIIKDDLEYLLTEIDNMDELASFRNNSALLCYFVDNKIVTFKELIDKHKNIKAKKSTTPLLWYLIDNKDSFEYWLKNDKLTTDDLKYLLSRIDNYSELDRLCGNTLLLKKVLNKFILTKEDINKLNELVKSSFSGRWCNIFDYIKYDCINHKRNTPEEVLKLTELNEKFYTLSNFNLTEDQKLEIAKIAQNNEKSKNILISLIENNLEDQYEFDRLKNVLTKEENKKLMTKFNF